jgi:hypothetical protein
MQCATHPHVETYVRCSKCGKAICPQCMVSTPVGYRCRDCAVVRTMPAYNLKPEMIGRAVAAAAGLVIAGGFGWALVFQLRFSMLLIIAGAGIGWLIAEGVSRAAGRRTSTLLPPLAGASAGLSVLAGNVMAIKFFTDLPWSFALRLAFNLDLWTILAGLLAVGVAVGRLRS